MAAGYSRILERLGLARRASPYLYYVVDDQGWALDQVGASITTHLSRRGLAAQTGVDPWHLRNAAIHFGNRYAFFHRRRHRLLRRNRTFLTWLHGDPAETEFRGMFENLSDSIPELERIVVPCRITEEALRLAGVPSSKLVRIPLGVDTELFRPPIPPERRELRERLAILSDAICVGSFQKDGVGFGIGSEPKVIKGPNVLVEVLTRLHETEPRIVALLTGPARGFVKAGLERRGVPYRHVMVRDYRDLAPLVRAVDMCLITSRCEGGPMALLESWASGVPVVSTRVGMAADLIRSGENGLLAEVDDVGTLVHQASRLGAEFNMRKRISDAAREESKRFDWSEIADRHLRLYFPEGLSSVAPKSCSKLST